MACNELPRSVARPPGLRFGSSNVAEFLWWQLYNNFSPYPPQQQNNAMPRYDNAASAYGLPTGQSTHPSHWSGTDSGAHMSSFDSSYGANIPASAYNERGIAQPHLPGAPPAHHQRAWLHEMPPSTPTHQDIVERIMRDSHHHEHASPTPWIPGYQDEQAFVNSFLRTYRTPSQSKPPRATTKKKPAALRRLRANTAALRVALGQLPFGLRRVESFEEIRDASSAPWEGMPKTSSFERLDYLPTYSGVMKPRVAYKDADSIVRQHVNSMFFGGKLNWADPGDLSGVNGAAMKRSPFHAERIHRRLPVKVEIPEGNERKTSTFI